MLPKDDVGSAVGVQVANSHVRDVVFGAVRVPVEVGAGRLDKAAVAIAEEDAICAADDEIIGTVSVEICDCETEPKHIVG